MLSSDHAEYYMTLSSFLPSLEEVKDAAAGTGKIIKRGGFAWSRDMISAAKTNSVYMMASGACFPSGWRDGLPT